MEDKAEEKMDEGGERDEVAASQSYFYMAYSYFTGTAEVKAKKDHD